LTRSKVDEQFGTIRPAIEAYYQLLDHTVRSLELPLVDVKKDLPEVYEAFCLVFKTLNTYYEEVNNDRV
jgi:hypothetical protein